MRRSSCADRSSGSPRNGARCRPAEDYVFEAAGPDGKPARVKLSERFAPGKDTLAIYSFMYGPERERPCPGCTHFLDSLDGAVRHTRERMNFAVV
jgi:predicted dithiol-disulfide oxidoreductase (DUF899 family)